MPPMAKLGEQRHIRAVRDGVVATLPLVIVGSFFLLIAFPPVPAWAKAMEPHVAKILNPFRLTVGLMALYASFGMAFSLARSYGMDGLTSGILGMGAFILTTLPQNIAQLADGSPGPGWVLPFANWGGQGLFTAMLVSLLSVEIARFLYSRKLMFRMPEGVPPAVARSFEALIPGAVVVTLVWLVRGLLNFDIQSAIMNLFKPLVVASDSLAGALIPILLVTLLWSAGIHGVSVVGPVARPIWYALFEANAAAAAAGQPLPHIVPEQFFQWFVWIGGSGMTLSMVLLMVFSRSDYLRKLGRASLLPGIANINEPIIFGTPIVMNPVLAIPFILAPMAAGTVTYFAMKVGLVGRPFIAPPWTLPGPIGAYLATGGDWRAAALNLFNVFLGVLIYWPFFRAYERRLEAEAEAKNRTA